MIKMSTLKKPDEVKLKREIDSHILNYDIFLDTSIAIDDPIEQSPEQSPAQSSATEVVSPQLSSSDDDVMEDLEPSNSSTPLPYNNADNINDNKLKEAWEKIYPSETFPDEHIYVSNDATSGHYYTLLEKNLKCGFIAKHPANYQLVLKGYFYKT
jgi:hypothetical protein